MVLFNNYVLPESNHRLAGLTSDIGRTRPTVNIEPGKFVTAFRGYELLIGDKDEKNVRLMWIPNTLELEEVLVSEAMLPDVKANPNLQVVGGPFEIKFQADGYIEEFFSRRVPGAAH